ncbi:hypothetical protein K443DRAFT_10418 [Laccaria amethystina LaAM-08-1]|uniref:Unplaced genomic scaffold K443scaffold_177, whole genome shotgun sequence n=1 Tax=Laccaria amethystina LaAM-08-1 TaxID=1095629 RepID=A0A0C9XGC4_9AGAR|nr:hypothetical protein K443DRAFT_10418 [Laccaria amethystina LaAM-08-1]
MSHGSSLQQPSSFPHHLIAPHHSSLPPSMPTTRSNIPVMRDSHTCLSPPISNTPRKRATAALCHIADSNVATKRTTWHKGRTTPMDNRGEG